MIALSGVSDTFNIHIITSKLLRYSSGSEAVKGCGERGGGRCFDACLEREDGRPLLVEDVPGVHVAVLPGHEEDGGPGGAPAPVQQALRVGAAASQ